jgi:hypothetical protein
MVRREFLAVIASTVGLGGTTERGARAIVRSGELGEVRFCRLVGDRERLVEFVRHVFGDSDPVSVTEMGTRATVRYTSCIASYEGPGEDGVWFCGSEGTLRVSGNGLEIRSGDGRSRRI